MFTTGSYADFETRATVLPALDNGHYTYVLNTKPFTVSSSVARPQHPAFNPTTGTLTGVAWTPGTPSASRSKSAGAALSGGMGDQSSITAALEMLFRDVVVPSRSSQVRAATAEHVQHVPASV